MTKPRHNRHPFTHRVLIEVNVTAEGCYEALVAGREAVRRWDKNPDVLILGVMNFDPETGKLLDSPTVRYEPDDIDD